MDSKLNFWFEVIKLVLGSLGLVTAYLAAKTYKASIKKQQEDRIRDADRELVAQAQTSLRWAYDVLTDEGEQIPPKSDRLNWLTCARHLIRYQKLAQRIGSETYQLVQAEHEEYWRHRFYLALDHNVLASTGFFSTGEVEPWPEKIEVSSAMVIVDFANWPKALHDPTDDVDRKVLATTGNAFGGRAGRGLKAYVELLERKRRHEAP